MVGIRLLGAVGVEVDGREMSVGGPKPRGLLAVLALAAPRASSSEQIVDALWGDDPPASARNAVQVNVTGLRKSLAPYGVAIERVGDGYSLRGAFTVDVAQFEEQVSAGRAALRSGDARRSAVILSAALRLWQGPPLGGLDGAAFTASARQPLVDTHAAALADLAQAQLRAGDAHAAARSAQTLIAEHRYDERGWIVLATAHYRSGQQDQALETCRTAREMLLDELGIDPTARLAELESQILNHALPAAETRTDSPPREEPPLPTLPVPFVGRDELVDDAAGRLARGIRLVTLVGIGGIGKTTLATAIAHRVADTGLPVRFCGLSTDLDEAAALNRACRTVGIDAADDPVTAIAESGWSGVLVLDNAEQLGALGEVLDDVLRATESLAVVVTSRRPTGARHEHTLLVPALSATSAEQMFRAHAERVRPGIWARSPEAVQELCDHLDGIPLAVELAAGRVRTLTPRQLLDRIEDQRASVLEGSSEVAAPERQASLDVVLHEAYAALVPEAQPVFALLGSCEGWVSIELLEAAALDLVGDFVAALDTLAGCGLVELDLEGRVRMKGPVREFARRLGSRSDYDLRVVTEAVRLAVTSAPHLFGAEAAETLGTLRRDEDTLTVALGHAVSLGDAEAAGRLATALNRYWLLTGQLGEGRQWIERVATLHGHSPQGAARLALLAGTFASYVNDPASGDLLPDALAVAERLDLPIDRLRVNGWCCLAAYAAHHHDFETADRAAVEAGRLAEVSADERLVALARDVDGHVAAYLGDHERSLAANLSGLRHARRDGDTYDEVNVLVNAASDLLYLDRLDEAIAYADEAFDLIGTLPAGPMLGSVLLLRGSALAAAGRPSPARGSLLEALRILRDRYPDPLATADALFTVGACAASEDDVAGAARCFGAAEALYADNGLTADGRLAGAILRARTALADRVGVQSLATREALGAGDAGRTVDLLLGDATKDAP